MNLNQLIIAFLSPRDPAVYTEQAIATRINKSTMLDRRVTAEEVHVALHTLHKMGLVGMQTNQLDESVVWQISPAGIKEWALEGRITVV